MKNTKKIITVILFSLVLSVAAHAQIFLTDEDESANSLRVETNDFWFDGGTPYQGGDLDQYTPIGSGLLLLMGLGGAYLLTKRKREE